MGKPLNLLISLILLVVVGYLGYAVWYTLQVNPEQGLVVCVPPGEQKTFTQTTKTGEKVETTVGEGQEVCFWTAHIHATLDLIYCGVKQDLPKDKGDLRGPHTHKEPNKMHSPHSPQKVEPTTKDFLDPTPLTVKGFLDAMEIDTKTPCPRSSSSSAAVTVNEQLKNLDYIWKDGDKLEVLYE